MTQLEKLLNCVATSSECDELTATVFQLAADSAALKFHKRKEALAEIENAPTSDAPRHKKKAVSTTLQFTMREITKMSKTFKKEFIANGLVAHVIKRESGKNSFYYEIRYRRNGYNLRAANKDLAVAKAEFIELTKHLESPAERANAGLKFDNMLNEWFHHKKGKVATDTLSGYQSLARRFIGEEIRKKNITKIRTVDLDECLPEFEEYPRRYEDLRTIFNGVFKYAAASGVITNNPVSLIPFRRAERIPRVALTNNQILSFLLKIQESRYDPIRQCAYALYFFGLRPCEVDQDARFENGFLIARNRKRKNGKIEYKKIPIPKQAQGLINFNQPEIVDIWMGDSPQRLVGKHYVHYSDEFMRSKMDLVNFPTL